MICKKDKNKVNKVYVPGVQFSRIIMSSNGSAKDITNETSSESDYYADQFTGFRINLNAIKEYPKQIKLKTNANNRYQLGTEVCRKRKSYQDGRKMSVLGKAIRQSDCQGGNNTLATISTSSSKNLEKNKLIEKQVVATKTRGKRIKPWTEPEKIILVGLVFEILFRRGSLFPNIKGGEEKGMCWKIIKQKFDVAIKRYTTLTRNSLNFDARTKIALERRYKILKKEAAMRSTSESLPFFKRYYIDWKTKYNANYRLTCTDQDFAQLLSNP